MKLSKNQMIKILKTLKQANDEKILLSHELGVKEMENKMLGFLLNEERSKNEKKI